MKKKIVLCFAFLFLILFCFTFIGCSKDAESPDSITVLHNGEKTVYQLYYASWNGVEYQNPEPFDYLFNYSLSSIPVAAEKNSFKISFANRFPDSYTLIYRLYNEKGEILSDTEDKQISAKLMSGCLVFELEDALNADYSSIPTDCAYIGFDLKCTVEKNDCEYAFLLKLDTKNAVEEQTSETFENIDCTFKAYMSKVINENTDVKDISYEIIGSYADLTSFMQENKNTFELGEGEDSFYGLLNKLDDTYFKEKLIILVKCYDRCPDFSSGNASVICEGGKIFVTINRNIISYKSSFTFWLLTLEISKNSYHGEELSIGVADGDAIVSDTDKFNSDMYLISSTGCTETGYENVFLFTKDGTVKLRLNNYNGFYSFEGTYTLDEKTIRINVSGEDEICISYSSETGCYVFESEALGTMYKDTRLVVTDEATFNSVSEFHDAWNSKDEY